MFTEFFDESVFPSHENFGSYWSANKNSIEEIAEREFNIPAIYAEVESQKRSSKSLAQLSVTEKYNTLDQHLNYLEHSFSKIGNQISLKAIGYYRVDTQKDMSPKAPSHNRVMLVLDVTNHGLSD